MNNYFNLNNYKPYFTVSLFNNLLFLIILITGVYSVTITNDLAIKGYTISELQATLNDQISEKEEKELKIAQLKSFNNLNTIIAELNYVEANDIEYITIEDKETVAMK